MLDPGTSSVMSLPTGAGKTTLAELKIAATTSAGGKVIYLSPTHALADQVTRELRHLFDGVRVVGSGVAEGQYAEIVEDALPIVSVMTPERCLTLVGVVPEAFVDVGLIVFDECHLLHPRKGYADRRNIDAMLCFLKLLDAAPCADVLLMSAMVSNTRELSRWVEELTGRKSLAIGIAWKPTRQARGCLVFDDAEIDRLQSLLKNEKNVAFRRATKMKPRKSGGVPPPGNAVRNKLQARPLGFFCLQQTWTTARDDYTLLPLSDGSVPLAANSSWYLTPNKNVVAAEVATKFAALNVKTLVFIQDKRYCESVARGVAENLAARQQAAPMTAQEEELLRIAVDEAGGPEHVLGNFSGLAVCHHGLMLSAERHLTESMFCRADGPAVLAATPTLAQGMNLPAEVVIIAGDDRREEGGATPLEAHELLNAAGRAGRAGHVADGVVLVIPGDVVSIGARNYKLGRKWFELQKTVFAKTDQCLQIDDPIEYFLDLLHRNLNLDETLMPYMVSRLPVDDDGGDAGALRFIRRSLSHFRARRSGNLERYEGFVEGLMNYRRALNGAATAAGWRHRVSASSGFPVTVIEGLDQALHNGNTKLEMSVREWVDWLFDWLELNPDHATQLLDCGAANRVLKEPIEPGDELRNIVPQLMDRLRPLVQEWMTGKSLRDIEMMLGTSQNRLGTCDRAREFVLRRIPDVSYAMGLVTQIHRGFLHRSQHQDEMPIALATVAACVRDGHRDPIELAVRYASGRPVSRRQCAALRDAALGALVIANPRESFPTLRRRVRLGLTHYFHRQ